MTEKRRRPRISERDAVGTSVDGKSVDKRLSEVREKLYGKEGAKQQERIDALAVEITNKSKSAKVVAFSEGGEPTSIHCGKVPVETKEFVKKCWSNLDKWKQEFDERKVIENAQKKKRELAL